MEIIRAIFVFIYQTFVNKTTASTAVGSGSVIFVLFNALSTKIDHVDAKVDKITMEGRALAISEHARMDRVNNEKFDSIKELISYSNKSMDIMNGKLDRLDQRVYDLKGSRNVSR